MPGVCVWACEGVRASDWEIERGHSMGKREGVLLVLAVYDMPERTITREEREVSGGGGGTFDWVQLELSGCWCSRNNLKCS